MEDLIILVLMRGIIMGLMDNISMTMLRRSSRLPVVVVLLYMHRSVDNPIAVRRRHTTAAACAASQQTDSAWTETCQCSADPFDHPRYTASSVAITITITITMLLHHFSLPYVRC